MALSSYREMGRGRVVPTSPEVRPTLPCSEVIFEPRLKYNSLGQAIDMGLHGGITITQEQERLYSDLREKPLDGDTPSDQVLMAKVLEITGGSVDVFKAAYPNITKWN